MGLTHETNNTQQIAEFTAALDAKFNITPWLLAVPVITGILIARRVPSVITLFSPLCWQGYSPSSSTGTTE